MWTDLDVRIEECRVKRLVAEECLRIEVLRFQPEIERFLLQARVWAATHREEGGDTDGNQDRTRRLQTDD